MSSTPRTAFDAEAGTAQGRILPTGWTPPSGAYAYVLGHDRPGVLRWVTPGDSVSITQSIDLAGISFVRVRAHVRAPASMPAGLTWTLATLVNSETSIAITLDRDRELYDLALPCGAYQAAGSVPIEIALTLTGAGTAPVEVEIPGVYLDVVTSDTTPAAIGICNRNPEPDETAVPLSLPVRFLVTDPSGISAISEPTIIVTVGGVIAFSGSAPQNGFTGASASTADGLGYTVTLTPPAPWLSLVTYAVHVQASTVGGSPLDVTYSFTTADTIAPLVLDALAIDPLTVRITFDEPMDGTSTILPAAYVLALISGAPAVTPGVVAVSLESPTTALLTLDRYATRGALYRVTVTGPTDAVGNAVAAPNNVASFTGWIWDVPEGRDIDLFRLLPEAIQSQDESHEHRDFLGVLQEVFDLFFALADLAPETRDPDTAAEPWIDLMLAELGNPFQLALTLTEKRRLVQLLVPIYQTKGTGPGIVSVIRLFTGIDVTLRVYAWAPYPIGEAIIGQTFVLGSSTQADLYTFEVVVPVFLTAEQRVIIREILDVMIVAHEHYRLIEPVVPVSISHWQLGFSVLGTQTVLH